MAKIVHGERIGKLGRLVIGCTAVVFDPSGQRVLLTRRSDNGRWCLPGGQMEAGESAPEACAREVWEETGLRVQVGKLVGLYSNPNRIIEYADGNRYHVVGLCFLAEPLSGELGLSNETDEVGYFSPDQIEDMDLMEPTADRVTDAFASRCEAFIR